MRAAVHNLGCKVNSYELDVIVQDLVAAGYEIVPFEEEAEVYIVNTCSVTNIADRKSRQMLHRARHTSPDALVVAVGCYVETDRTSLEADPLVDLCVGNNRKGSMVPILQEALAQKKRQASLEEHPVEQGPSLEYLPGEPDSAADGGTKVSRGSSAPVDKTLGGRTMANLKDHPAYETMQLSRPGRTRADVKIQDGCNLFCSYCIIPYARGRIRSRDPEDIAQEVRRLSATGTREVVLTGIHVSSYRQEEGLVPAQELLQLLQRLQLIAGIRRIRLSSLEPRIMTEDFVRGIRRLSKVCPHFHLSLQSGCDATLRRMNRHYTSQQYLESVERIRAAYDFPAITTDVIVGFPGETQEEFDTTLEFVKKVGFYEVHVFRYSRRNGTAAASFPNPCTDQEKAVRSARLLALTKEQANAFREEFVGRREELLLEEEVVLGGESYFAGHTMRYVEGIVPAAGHHSGELVSGVFEKRIPGTKYLLLREEL